MKTARLWASLLAVYPSSRLAAQDSQFGIHGLGTPGRWESVRARSTGGAFAPFDPLSPLTEASIADIGRLTATAAAGASYRDADVSGTTTALRATRFPLMQVAGPVASRFVVTAGFTTYLDRTWAVTLRDSAVLRGKVAPYTDVISSDGSISDLRLAVASRVSRHIAIGAGMHLLAGSTHEMATRHYDDSTFALVQQSGEVRYDGFGVSGSVIINVAPGLALAGWARSDNRLRARVADTTTNVTDLPRMAGGGIVLAPSSRIQLAGSAAWRSWAHAGPGSFDTWTWSGGGEIGFSTMQFRLGARGGQMPFGPGSTAPTEVAVATGVGRGFAQGRALMDLGLERLERRGGGLTERVWTVLVGITVRP
ncbi:MAG TPA: hypothetical protein VM716_16510 [Gemmatimonadales bacterium]|nr:hypothetical protein [Gemmatimonadales bacterium]